MTSDQKNQAQAWQSLRGHLRTIGRNAARGPFRPQRGTWCLCDADGGSGGLVVSLIQTDQSDPMGRLPGPLLQHRGKASAPKRGQSMRRGPTLAPSGQARVLEHSLSSFFSLFLSPSLGSLSADQTPRLTSESNLAARSSRQQGHECVAL